MANPITKPTALLVSRSRWLLRQFTKRIWVRATMFSVGAVATNLLAVFVDRYIPYDLSLSLASGSVDHILDILASSMLAVTTFSLSIMVSAYSAATSNVTPRSTKLLLDDSVAQNTLSTFIGSFLFSIVGIIGLAAGLYGANGRIVLFLATLFVITLITGTLLLWIEQLGRFGRVSDTIRRVEKAASDAAELFGRLPRLGARPSVAIPRSAATLLLEKTGYIQHIDAAALQDIAEKNDLVIHLPLMPGGSVHPVKPVAHIEPAPDEDVREALLACFSVDDDRAFDQDPRFGLIVLSEIASRALSPAVNDPGTSIEVIAAGTRVLIGYGQAMVATEEIRFDRLHAPEIEVAGLFEDFFNPIARDGPALVEVHIKLQSALEALAENFPALFGDVARNSSQGAFVRAEEALTSGRDVERLRKHTRWAALGERSSTEPKEA